jgi:hypothetical protein
LLNIQFSINFQFDRELYSPATASSRDEFFSGVDAFEDYVCDWAGFVKKELGIRADEFDTEGCEGQVRVAQNGAPGLFFHNKAAADCAVEHLFYCFSSDYRISVGGRENRDVESEDFFD